MSSLIGWFAGLSKLGRTAAIGATIASGYTASAIIAQPDTAQQQATPTEAVVKAAEPNEPVVTHNTETEAVAIPFEQTTQEDGALASGQTRLAQAGINGSKVITHKITLTDGQETARETTEEITTHPTPQITIVGTYVAPPPQPAPSSYGVVKLSRNGICHAPGTTYYNQTRNFTGYDSLDACLGAGGRMPKR